MQALPSPLDVLEVRLELSRAMRRNGVRAADLTKCRAKIDVVCAAHAERERAKVGLHAGHIRAATRPHLRRDSPTSAPGLSAVLPWHSVASH